MIRTLVSEAGKDRALSEMGRDFWQERFEMAREIIRRAIARGELDAETDPNARFCFRITPVDGTNVAGSPGYVIGDT